MSASTHPTTTAGHPAAMHGCWEILLRLTRRYPVTTLGELMRVTRLAEHAHWRGLPCEEARDRD